MNNSVPYATMYTATYPTVYTLVTPFPTSDKVHSILNGRIVRIKKSKDGCLHIYDAVYGDLLINTTSVYDRDDEPGGFITIRTESGTDYHFRRLDFLIPTAYAAQPPEPSEDPKEDPKDKPEEKVPEPPAPEFSFNVINEEETWKDIHYGDGHRQIEYTFDREITRDEFLKFCEAKGHDLKPEGAWYEDYAMIFGEGSKWTYRWVRRYTD